MHQAAWLRAAGTAGAGGCRVAVISWPRRTSERRARNERAAKFTRKVMTNSTRPVKISALTSTPEDSGNFSAMLAAMVEGFWFVIRFTTPRRPPRAAARPAIVSPSARPECQHGRADDAGPAVGEHRHPDHLPAVAPRASAASSCSRGVCRKTSRQMAVMIGKIITASTRPTLRIVRPVFDAGPAKNGMNERWSAQPGVRRLHLGGQEEDAPEAVHDAGDRCQQVDGVAEALGQPRGAKWEMNRATPSETGTANSSARIAASTVP
jgi:hypothetical protein